MVSMGTIAEMLAPATNDIDRWTIRRTDDSRYVVFDYVEGDAQISIGPRFDGTYAVVATETQHIGTVGTLPQTKEYRRVRDIEDTVEEATDLCEKYESQIASQSTSPKTVPMQEVVDRLTEEECQFLAVPKNLLAYGVFGVVIDGSDDFDASSIAQYWNDIEAVQVGESSLSRGPAIPSQPRNFHFGGRVPLYASERTVSALETVGSEQGFKNVDNYVQRVREGRLAISPKVEELETILANLVDAGVAAIALEEEVSHSDRLTFSVYIHPAIGYELVAECSAVELDGRKIDVVWECRVDGPNFRFRTPVFATDDIIGLDSVSISDGLTNVREFVNTSQNQREGGCQ